MILYTIMPEQLVYPADYSQCESQKVVNINGVELMVSEEEHGCYSIVRVLSTNPFDYLEYEPGQKITF
ncbi:YlzJ-like family protein [Bacillus luti]|uniref:Ribonuclease n=1 Tax=Bacillus luti TaxID=2026191 RepID=A0A7V7V5W8_9BACI|nr:YlzJ-like family protein [Bacillus luti]KAB2444275.1 ribonuclease [Bacillus luti]